jgi:L-arabinokinase
MSRRMHVGRAPGRLDIMGGNADYTGGLVFEATIREGTWAAVALREDERIVLHNPQMAEHGWQQRAKFRLSELTDEARIREIVNRDPGLRWTAYVIGIFYFLRRRYPKCVVRGADVYIRSRVPLNKGVSSSAAVEVAVMKTAAHAYGIELKGIELAEASQLVENEIAQSACGIMDQIAAVLGEEGCILPVLCQPCIPRPLVRLPAELTCWGIDSGVRHAVTGHEYEAARAAAFMGYKLICDWEGLPVRLDSSRQIRRWTDARWNGYLANLSPSLFRSRFELRLPESISGSEYLALAGHHVDPFTKVQADKNYRIRANTRYAAEEHARVELFAELARGKAGFLQMGELMYQSHFAYTECGLGCAATDLLVDLVREEGPANGLYGAKITGGGAGGTVAVLGRRDAHESFGRVVRRYGQMRKYTPYIFEGSSAGADAFGVQVFPASV